MKVNIKDTTQRPLIGLVIVSGYIFLGYAINFAGLILPIYFPNDIDSVSIRVTLKYIITIAGFFVIVLLTWIEIETLEQFHIDRGSLLILLLFGPFLRIEPHIKYQSIFVFIIGISCVVILGLFFHNKSKIPVTNLRFSAKGLIQISTVLLLVMIIETFQSSVYVREDILTYNFSTDLLRRTIYNLSSTSTVEEIIFRGYLWGYVNKLTGNTKTAYLTQAILFWFGHIVRIFSTPITFFVTLPISIVLYSEITRRINQVYWSIFVHTLVNVCVPVILTVIINSK